MSKHFLLALSARLPIVAAVLAVASVQLQAAQASRLSPPLMAAAVPDDPLHRLDPQTTLASPGAYRPAMLLQPDDATAATSPARTSDAVLVCPDFVDLRWEPHAYDFLYTGGEECEALTRALYRAPHYTTEIDEMDFLGAVTATDYSRRDRSVVEGGSYQYTLHVIYTCPIQGFAQAVMWWLTPSLVQVTESCLGDIYEDETFTGVLTAPSLAVREGATLRLPGADVVGGEIASAGSSVCCSAPGGVTGGVMQITGATLDNTRVTFTARGSNSLSGSRVIGQANRSEIHVESEAEVLIDGNSLFSGWVKIEGLPKVNVVGNDFHEGMITIETGGGAPLDQVTISKNRFYDAAQAAAIRQYAGSATIVGNHFVRINPEASDRAIDVGEPHHGSVPVVANILDNVIVGFDSGIRLAGGAVATIRGNVLQYCEDEALSAHHDAQATIEENTFVNSRAGLKFWNQVQVTLRANCITGNTRYGVYTSSEEPGLQVDARENWWGHASGAKHPSNPGGRGDEATAPVLVSNPLLMDNCFSDSSTAVIGSQGGNVSSSAGHTSLAVPGGALSTDTRVALRPMDRAALATMPAPPANGAGLRLFQVAARRVSDGVPLSTLSAQAELSVTYAEADRLGIDEDTLAIYRLDGVQQAASSAPGRASSAASWTPLSGELNADHNVLTGRTATLGTFAVLGEREEAHICLPLLLAAAR